jgi:hypothetical protein
VFACLALHSFNKTIRVIPVRSQAIPFWPKHFSVLFPNTESVPVRSWIVSKSFFLLSFSTPIEAIQRHFQEFWIRADGFVIISALRAEQQSFPSPRFLEPQGFGVLGINMEGTG